MSLLTTRYVAKFQFKTGFETGNFVIVRFFLNGFGCNFRTLLLKLNNVEIFTSLIKGIN